MRRWFQAPAGTTLFHVTKDPIDPSDFEELVNSDDSVVTRWGRSSTIEVSCRMVDKSFDILHNSNVKYHFLESSICRDSEGLGNQFKFAQSLRIFSARDEGFDNANINMLLYTSR